MNVNYLAANKNYKHILRLNIYLPRENMAHDNLQKNEIHHHDWLVKKIEDRIAKLMTGDVEPSVPIPPKKSLEISHIVSPPEKTRSVLEESDIISLHVPYMKSTHHMIDKKAFSKMKKGVVLINTARGGLVNTNDLVWALDKGILRAAGLDVIEEERFIKEKIIRNKE